MTIEEIRNQVTLLNHELLEKEWKTPNCLVQIEEHEYWIRLVADHPVSTSYSDHLSGFIKAETLEDLFSTAFPEAFKRIRLLPSQEDAGKEAFLKSLAKTIDMGKELNIDTDFLNPLIEQMRELSENILTDQSPSEWEEIVHKREENTEEPF